MNALNLESINEAFGESADLYRDILGVKANASNDQIQRAYFERRNELFQLLAELESTPELDSSSASRRAQAERKMDAIVMTLRILGDKSLRSAYDDVRLERVALRNSNNTVTRNSPAIFTMEEEGDIPMKPKSVLKKSSYNISIVEVDTSQDEGALGERSELTGMTNGTSTFSTRILPQDTSYTSSPERNSTAAVTFGGADANSKTSSKNSKKRKTTKTKRKVRRVSPDQPRSGNAVRRKKMQGTDETFDSTLASDVESVASEGSFRTMETSYTTYERNRGYFQAMKDEIMGAIDDTSQSFHQVFSVFTLREDEIDAVAGRIDKARRQMIHSFSNN